MIQHSELILNDPDSGERVLEDTQFFVESDGTITSVSNLD